eukprot:scaffold4570_cov81-Cylindrotheca_fusiformis.AAC.9
MMTLTEDQPDIRVASQGVLDIMHMMTLAEDQPDVRVASQGVAKRLMLKPSSSLERFVRLLQGKRAQKWDLRLFRPRGSTAVRPLPSDSRVSSHACTERFQGSWTRSVRMR